MIFGRGHPVGQSSSGYPCLQDCLPLLVHHLLTSCHASYSSSKQPATKTATNMVRSHGPTNFTGSAFLQAQPNDSPPTPPVPARSIDRQPTPRPFLFPSFEEAHFHVLRSQRTVSSDESQALGRNDDPAGMDTQEPSSSMPRAPPNSPRPEPATSASDFAIWEDIPEPLNTLRAAISSTLPASQVSGSSVDQIIDHYGQPSSSAPQSQAAVCGSEPELDHCTGQSAAAMRANASAPAVRVTRFGTPLVYSEGADTNKKVDTHAPRNAMPAIPFHSSNPFSIVSPRPNPRVTGISTPTTVFDDQEDSEYYEARTGSGSGAVPRTGSEEAPSDAESRIGQLMAPPARMNSARRQQQQRGRSTVSYNSNSLGGAMNEESDDDPFLYDQPSVFLQPSREREVSACLRKVSGMARESTATIYSQDGSPSKMYHDGQFFINDQPVSPGSSKLLDELACLQAPTHNPFDATEKRPQHRASGSVGGRFYDPRAVRSEWALGNPDVVKVPVKAQNNKENRFARGSQNPAEVGGFQNEDEINWAALKRHDEAQAQAHRTTGDTED